MTQIRLGTPGDAARERELWQLAFGDDGAYVDNFYQTYYKPERMLLLEEDGVVQSMTAWFDTQLVLPGEGRFRAAYLYAVATDPAARGRGLAGRLLAGADEYFRGLAIPAVTTVPAEPSLHNFFGANGFRECFTLFQEALDPGELPAPAWDNPLRPVSPEEYGAVRPHPHRGRGQHGIRQLRIRGRAGEDPGRLPPHRLSGGGAGLSGRMLRPVRRRPVCRGDGGRPCLRLRRRGRGGSGGV